jgi:Tol biopolymer transport system component
LFFEVKNLKLFEKFLLLFMLSLSAVCLAQQTPAGVLFVGVKNNSSDIYLWLPDGETGQAMPLTQTPQKEGNARWWPGKKLILASREISENHYGIVALDSSLKTVWTCEDPVGSLGWPVPSPYDDRILCVRQVGNGFVQTGFVTYPDGDFTPLEFNGLSGGQLAWLAPDKIQLSRVTTEGFVITQRDLNTHEEKIIVRGGNNWQSFVDEHGNNLFVRRVGQTGSIFQLFKDDDDAWEYENVTNARTYDWQPSTSPDGQTMIFRSLRGGRFFTVTRNLKTGAEKVLPMPGFAEIYFPMILDAETVQTLVNAL